MPVKPKADTARQDAQEQGPAIAPGQLGRIFENLVENAYTAQSDGRLASYVPVVDSRGVDRALSLDGGPPLWLQVKGHLHARPRGGRLAFAIPETGVGAYPRWVAALVSGAAGGLKDAYVVPGDQLLAHAERGHLVDGRPCLRLTVSPTSPTWGRFRTGPEGLGARLVAMAAGEAAAPKPLLELEPGIRSQEEGAYFEAAVTAALLGASGGLALYRPAPDFAGRDLLVQGAGEPRYLFVQIKGSRRLDGRDLVRFQVRRRTFRADPRLVYLFCYRAAAAPAGEVEAVWAVPAPELEERSAHTDPDHISFEAHIAGPDPRWQHRRSQPGELADAIVSLL